MKGRLKDGKAKAPDVPNDGERVSGEDRVGVPGPGPGYRDSVLPTGGEKIQNPLPQWGLDLVCGVERTTLCGKKKTDSLLWKAAWTEFKLQ